MFHLRLNGIPLTRPAQSSSLIFSPLSVRIPRGKGGESGRREQLGTSRPYVRLLLQSSDSLMLRSEREALRWVQKHIAAFGGDPTKVTLFVTSLPSYLLIRAAHHSRLSNPDGDKAPAVSASVVKLSLTMAIARGSSVARLCSPVRPKQRWTPRVVSNTTTGS